VSTLFSLKNMEGSYKLDRKGSSKNLWCAESVYPLVEIYWTEVEDNILSSSKPGKIPGERIFLNSWSLSVLQTILWSKSTKQINNELTLWLALLNHWALPSVPRAQESSLCNPKHLACRR
jgi:hypothetical protein